MSRVCAACGGRYTSVTRHALWHVPREIVTGELSTYVWRNDRKFRPVMVIMAVVFVVFSGVVTALTVAALRAW